MIDINKIAEDSLPVIERDIGKVLDQRTRRVIHYWMVRAMQDVRVSTLAQQKAKIDALAQSLADEISTLGQQKAKVDALAQSLADELGLK